MVNRSTSKSGQTASETVLTEHVRSFGGADCTEFQSASPIHVSERQFITLVSDFHIASLDCLGDDSYSPRTGTCMRNATALLGCLGATGLLLAGCGARTEVSHSGNAPAQYSHVYITTQEVWFNTSATAGPDDSGWTKFPLTTPATVDLVGDEDGTLGTIATNVNLVAGTYSQIRLIPIDSAAPLSVSATAIGATYNAEADYVDPTTGTTVQLPLELLNPDKGIGIQASLKVPIGSVGSAGIGAIAGGSSSIGTDDATSSAGTTDATGIGTSTGTTTTTTTIASFTVNIDGNRDLVPFLYAPTGASSGINGIMLSSHATAFDLSQVTGIQGTLTLTNLTGYTAVSGLPDIQATAESLSADGTRHEVVLSVPVHSDGTFLLYPLPTSSSTAVYYDVVIHGSGIATIIIKNVYVSLPSTSSSSSFGSSTTTGTTTTDTTTATTGTTTSLSAATINSTNTSIDTATITPPSLTTVSIGTLLPRYASTYTANITAASAALPAGADVAFYETLSGSGEVPYVIESSPIDPFNQNLFSAQTVSACTVDSGTFLANGETINVISAAPIQGAGGYIVAATAPNYADGAFSAKVAAPASCVTAAAGAAPPTTTTTTTATAAPVSVAVPALSLASGAATGSVVVVVTANSKYNAGQLLISHEGALVAQVPLTADLLASGGNVSATVPAGTASSLYYVSVRVWNTSDPAPNPAPPGTGLTAGTLSRQSFDTPADLRSTTSVSIPITIN